jgi:hypothetical protein
VARNVYNIFSSIRVGGFIISDNHLIQGLTRRVIKIGEQGVSRLKRGWGFFGKQRSDIKRFGPC